MEVLYVDYHFEAVSFRNKKKQREGRGEVLKMLTGIFFVNAGLSTHLCSPELTFWFPGFCHVLRL